MVDIELAPAWGGGLVAAVDGMRFVVPVKTIQARPNPKCFARDKGSTWLNLVNDQSAGLAGMVVSGTPTRAAGSIRTRAVRHWPDMLRVVGSIHTGEVRAFDVTRILQRDGSPTPLGDAFAH